MSEPPVPHPDVFHTLLQRQIRRIYGDQENVPRELQAFLPVVDEAYRQADADRRMLERSLDLSSHELLQANADLRAVVEDFVDVFFRLDANGVILDCRGGNEDCLMLPPKELIGKRIQDIPFPEIGERFARALDHAQRQAAVQSFDYGLPLSDTLTHYEAHVVPLPHNQHIVIIRDVTATKRSEARERELNARLARYRRMESLGMLAGGVAHDLNNILGPLEYHDGMNFAPVPSGANIVIGDNPTGTLVVDASTVGPVSGPGAIAQADSEGDVHTHIDFTLEPLGIDAGAYGLLMELTTDAAGIANSKSYYIVFNFGLEEDAFEGAVEAFAAKIPEPTSLTVLGMGVVLFNFTSRRRGKTPSCCV